MARPTLTRAGAKLVHAEIDHLFDKVKARYLGPDAFAKRGDKRLYIGYVPSLTLPGLYTSAANEEHAKPDEGIKDSLMHVAEQYLDAAREKTKARVTSHIDHFLRDAATKGIETDVETVLGGQLAEIFGQTTSDISRILDTEATHARNMGTLEGIAKVNAAAGIEDPVVYFIVTHDAELCGECRRLHLLKGTSTPRVWFLSEVGHGYHERGQANPKLTGLHPHCRCSIATLLPGYGFDGGSLHYVGKGYSEIEKQRKD